MRHSLSSRAQSLEGFLINFGFRAKILDVNSRAIGQDYASRRRKWLSNKDCFRLLVPVICANTKYIKTTREHLRFSNVRNIHLRIYVLSFFIRFTFACASKF